MSLIPWRRTSSAPSRGLSALDTPVADLRDEMERLFDRFVGRSGDPVRRAESATFAISPSVDVSERDDEITVTAEVPGIDPDDLDVTLSDRFLTISGEKREETERSDGDFVHRERAFGSFRRTIELPENADPDTLEAEEDNGVLTISIRKQPTTTSRKIEIKPSTQRGRRSEQGARP